MLRVQSEQSVFIEEQRRSVEESARLSTLGMMAGGIAHEINNPLAIILGKVNSAKRYLSTEHVEMGKVTSYLDVIEETSRRIHQIVHGLKSLSRDSSHDDFVATDIVGSIKAAIALSQEKCRRHGITLRSDLGDSAIVKGRNAQLGQVFLNLIGNSIDAIEKLSDRWIEIVVRSVGHEIRIEISDSGPGIPAAIVDQMMMPFFTTKEVGKGTGLGLSISRNIIEQHGGQLFYDRQSSCTKFVVTLPRFAQAACD